MGGDFPFHCTHFTRVICGVIFDQLNKRDRSTFDGSGHVFFMLPLLFDKGERYLKQ